VGIFTNHQHILSIHVDVTLIVKTYDMSFYAFWQLLLKVMSEKLELVIEKMFSNQLLNINSQNFYSLKLRQKPHLAAKRSINYRLHRTNLTGAPQK
jgi:hypothetical protein